MKVQQKMVWNEERSEYLLAVIDQPWWQDDWSKAQLFGMDEGWTKNNYEQLMLDMGWEPDEAIVEEIVRGMVGAL